MKFRWLSLLLLLLLTTSAFADVKIKEASGWFESAYVTWDLLDEAETYHVYYKPVGGEYELLDYQLVRNYGTYGRADMVGLAAGNYQFMVYPVDADGVELTALAAETGPLAVVNHVRGGYAHFNYSNIGAYNDDGTLKEGAKIIYVTAETAKTVTCSVITSSNGKVEEFTGLQTIIDAKQKGYDFTPWAIRIIGCIEYKDMDKFSSSEQGLQIKGKNGYDEMNITMEGIGDDATIKGFGVLLRNCTSVELRNFGIMLCLDDAISLDTKNSHCWVHNMDLFYGNTGSDSDQAKGDGTLDAKADSKLMTFSFNRFWDCGKVSLCGMKSETGENYITYHHNWFDHSDSRHPRVRTMTVHVYNNYYDGIAKYGVGATMDSDVFVENNYFRNTNRPMLISLQGTDIKYNNPNFSGEAGGMIKAYGNMYEDRSSNFSLITQKESATSFDCFEADSRNEKVPDTYKTLVGGYTYNNFDTDPSQIYTYTPTATAEVPAVVTGDFGAGRVQHGDFKFDFDNSVDDGSYSVNTALKDSLINYKSSLVGIFGHEDNGGGDGGSGGDGDGDGDPDPIEGYVCTFTGGVQSNPFYDITGNYSNSKGTATVDGITYTWCLKMESKTSIKFVTTEAMTLKLVFADGEVPNIKINNVKVQSTSGNIITYDLPAGSHELTKADTYNLFYINLIPQGTGIEGTQMDEEEKGDGIYYDIQGRPVSNPTRGIYIRNGKKVLVD